jgi:glycosyltransferase involved in cell wall biosynthesis
MISRLILIITKNSGKHIEEAVRSFKRDDTKVIVLDNASEDNTVQIALQQGAEVLKFQNQQGIVALLRHVFRYVKSAYPDIRMFRIEDLRFGKAFSFQNLKLEIRAPFWLWPIILKEFLQTYIRPKDLIRLIIPVVQLLSLVLLTILFIVAIDSSFREVSPPMFRAGDLGVVAEERLAAMEWLKNNSPQDAVVIADQFDGNYIVALANRRVVSSSKVYPSEANEVSSRYTDIAKFFFSQDEDQALEIAKKYGVDYVFVAYDFSYSKNCKLADACHFVSGGELTSVGKKMTLIGKFLNREPLAHFELVWDSPSFSIFRILNNRTFRNPCRLKTEEASVAFRIARALAGELKERCSIALSLYRNGRRLQRVFLSDKSMGDAIREFSQKLPVKIDSTIQLQFSVWQEDELVRRDIKRWLKQPLDTTKVLVMRRDNKTAIFLPEDLNLKLFSSNEEILNQLCEELGFENRCWQSNAKIFEAPVTVFLEDENGKVLTVSGPLPITSEVEKFDPIVFRKRLLLARDWIWRMHTRSGDFRNEIDPHNPEYNKDNTRLASLHGAAETWWLLEFYRAIPDLPQVVAFGRAQSDRFDRLINSGNEEQTAFLIYAGLENLSLWRITSEPLYLERAQKYANILRQLFIDEANLARSFRIREGLPQIVSKKSIGTIGNNSGLYFLAETLREKEIPVLRDAMLKFARALKDNFQKNRILDPDISIVWESWLVNAFSSVSAVTGNRQDALFALEVANWILDYQSRDIYPHLRGAFKNRAATSGVGKITEALIDAAWLAEKIGEDPKPYLKGFEEAMRWLMSVQYTDSSYFLSAKNRLEMRGALRSRLTDIKAEIDNAGHMVIAGAWYLRQIKK